MGRTTITARSSGTTVLGFHARTAAALSAFQGQPLQHKRTWVENEGLVGDGHPILR